MSRKVKNINGATDNTCRCGSWLNHWEKYGGILAGVCVEKSCAKPAEVGAHVMKVESIDQGHYLVPLCRDHYALFGQEIEIRGSAKMVSANTKETCAKD